MGEVMSFLRTVFGVDENHRMFQPDVLRWKCFAPHPFWEGSRGYALRYKGAMAAFGCLVPSRFLTGSATVASCNMIDWAASKAVPGAGAMLYRHIQELTGTMINIGGTEDARNLLPRIGFAARVERHAYARVLRPWGNFRQQERKNWKSPLRLARDLRDLARPAADAGSTVTARHVERPEDMPLEAFPNPSEMQQVVCERNPALCGYMLACPAAKTDAYLLEHGHAPAGAFLLSRVGTECRIADLWVNSTDAQAWAGAYAAATAAARVHPGVTKITVAASLSLQTRAIERAGFRRTQTEPVFVRDPNRLLGDRHDLAISLLENDGYFWTA